MASSFSGIFICAEMMGQRRLVEELLDSIIREIAEAGVCRQIRFVLGSGRHRKHSEQLDGKI